MRWIPFIAFFLYVYIEISIFIQVAHVLGVFMTLILVIFSSLVMLAGLWLFLPRRKLAT
ncbi:hypothetical protein ACVXJO_28155, partial [Klebsiella pneumoniae]